MKKTWIITALAAALLVQGSYAFAASGSSSSNDSNTVTSDTNQNTNQSTSQVIVAGSGQITNTTPAPTPDTTPATAPVKETITVPSTGTGTPTQINVVWNNTTAGAVTGSTIGVVVDTTTTTGVPITSNEKGEVVIGDTAVSFVDSTSTAATLPTTVAAEVANINAGKTLQESITTTTVDLTGYNALTRAHTIITKDAVTDQVKTGPVEVSVYVPNLVENLDNLSVLFYDDATGQWTLLPVVKVDAASKTVAVNIPGSGTMSVVYKAQ